MGCKLRIYCQQARLFEKLDSLEIANYTKSRLNFFPYVSSNQNSITKFNDNKIGAEIFYNSGTGTQINATFNPDFGQAESDDVVINFSAQETFYSEKELSLTRTSPSLILITMIVTL